MRQKIRLPHASHLGFIQWNLILKEIDVRIHAPIAISLLAFLNGCSTIGNPNTELPTTLGERSSGYGYIPLDGLAVEQTLESDSCKGWREFTVSKSASSTANELQGTKAGTDPFKPLLESLPDISVRFAVASFDSSGGLTFGPAKITSKYGTYRAVLDYVNVDAIPINLQVSAIVSGTRVKLSEARAYGKRIDGFDVKTHEQSTSTSVSDSDLVTIPVYVGVGMRVSADVTALEAGIPLVSLGAIGLEAQAKNLTGTLTVQTIGVTGESIAASLPLPSKLDQTTIENGILSIGANRSSIYKTQSPANGTTTTPRVVGIYSPIGSEPALVNAIYSELSRQRPKWHRPCKPPQ